MQSDSIPIRSVNGTCLLPSLPSKLVRSYGTFDTNSLYCAYEKYVAVRKLILTRKLKLVGLAYLLGDA